MASFFYSTRYILVAGLVALCFQSAYAHTYLSSVYLNDQLLTEGDCVRPHPSTAYDSPIPLVTSPDMTCGWLPQASQPANKKCAIAAGATIGIQWHHQSNSPSDDIIDPTHAGPIIVYLAKSDTGSGNVWFKIYEDGYSGGKWGVDRMLDKRGRVDIKIPSDIAPGNYLLRGEILALHGAYALNGVQPYVGCVELTVSGSGTANPSGVAFPGYYKNDDPGMLFNRYQSFSSYPIPGPALYSGGSGSGSGAAAASGSGSSGTATSGTGTGSSGSSSGTAAPTSKPTTAPPTAPTSRPTSTTKPTTRPTTKPTRPRVTVYPTATVWWLALTVDTSASKMEVKDAGRLASYQTMTLNNWGAQKVFTFSPQGTQLVTPISVRITSASGSTMIATITSITDNAAYDAQ